MIAEGAGQDKSSSKDSACEESYSRITREDRTPSISSRECGNFDIEFYGFGLAGFGVAALGAGLEGAVDVAAAFTG
jgi:hypothetical protein